MQRQALSIIEASQQLGISRSKAYQAAKTGEIPTIRIGKRILVPITALERMLAGNTLEPANEN